MAFSLKGRNIIYQDSTQNGMLPDDWKAKPFDPDGGRFDYGPEEVTAPIHAETWMGPWDAEVTGDHSLRISVPTDRALGLQSTREFALSPKEAKLTIKQTAVNTTGGPLARHFWGRALVVPGGEISFSVNPGSAFKNSWGLFLSRPRRIKPDSADRRIHTDTGRLRFTATGPTLKFGADIKKGNVDYSIGGLLFTNRYKIKNLKKYTGSDNMSFIVYHSKRFLEMEPVSQTFVVRPGRRVSFEVVWFLKDRS